MMTGVKEYFTEFFMAPHEFERYYSQCLNSVKLQLLDRKVSAGRELFPTIKLMLHKLI